MWSFSEASISVLKTAFIVLAVLSSVYPAELANVQPPHRKQQDSRPRIPSQGQQNDRAHASPLGHQHGHVQPVAPAHHDLDHRVVHLAAASSNQLYHVLYAVVKQAVQETHPPYLVALQNAAFIPHGPNDGVPRPYVFANIPKALSSRPSFRTEQTAGDPPTHHTNAIIPHSLPRQDQTKDSNCGGSDDDNANTKAFPRLPAPISSPHLKPPVKEPCPYEARTEEEALYILGQLFRSRHFSFLRPEWYRKNLVFARILLKYLAERDSSLPFALKGEVLEPFVRLRRSCDVQSMVSNLRLFFASHPIYSGSNVAFLKGLTAFISVKLDCNGLSEQDIRAIENEFNTFRSLGSQKSNASPHTATSDARPPAISPASVVPVKPTIQSTSKQFVEQKTSRSLGHTGGKRRPTVILKEPHKQMKLQGRRLRKARSNRTPYHVLRGILISHRLDFGVPKQNIKQLALLTRIILKYLSAKDKNIPERCGEELIYPFDASYSRQTVDGLIVNLREFFNKLSIYSTGTDGFVSGLSALLGKSLTKYRLSGKEKSNAEAEFTRLAGAQD